MITVKFSKIGYSRFLSHLDLQTIINRAIKRTGLSVNYSQGFNPHPILKMSPPIPLGIKSSAEYFTADLIVENNESFLEKLALNLPEGINPIMAWETGNQPKVTALSIAAGYTISIIDSEIRRNILGDKKLVAKAFDRTAEQLNIVENGNTGLLFVLPSGKNNVRIDRFLSYLNDNYKMPLSLAEVEKSYLYLLYNDNVVDADEYLNLIRIR